MPLPRTAYRPGLLIWLAILAATCLLLFAFQKTLWLVVPIVLAIILYYVLCPFNEALRMRGLSSAASAGIVVGGSFVGLLALLAPAMSDFPARMSARREAIMRYIDGGLRLLGDTLTELENRVELFHEIHLYTTVQDQIASFTEHGAARHLADLAVGAVSWAPSLLLAPFLVFFMLRDGRRFKHFIAQAVPNAFFERSLFLMDQVDRTARLYFVGLLQLTVLDTLCLALGLWLIGVSNALGLGLLTAVLAWIPFVGSVLGCVLVLLVTATDFPGQPGMAYAAILLFVIVRMLDDFVFMPMTIGKSLRLHPLLTVMMIFVGGSVAGVTGLMLVLPLLGVLMVIGETLGQVLNDPRLRARHRHARRLRAQLAAHDLD